MLDMFGPGVGHVQEIPLESNLEPGYAWLTWDKAKRPGISGMGVRHIRPLESG
jgi:hypothetical protein